MYLSPEIRDLEIHFCPMSLTLEVLDSEKKKLIERSSNRISEGTKRDAKQTGGKLPNFINIRSKDLNKRCSTLRDPER